MDVFRNRPDADTLRSGIPRAVKLVRCIHHDFFTFADDCEHKGDPLRVTRDYYAVIGTEYGYLHNTAGDSRLYRSATSAYRAAREYRGYNLDTRECRKNKTTDPSNS